MRVAVSLVAIAAAGVSGVRWLRVAQREHYLPGSVTRFAIRWWRLGPNALLLTAAVIAWLVTLAGGWLAGLVTAGAVAAGPFGLSLKGRTSKLAWTRRLRTLAAVWAVLTIALAAIDTRVAVTVALLTPLLVDAALGITLPIERRLGEKFVAEATRRLQQVRPTVVAITGSYGKTGTKGYVAHLVGSSRTVVASPASFNNRAGLARTVNEHLVPGTEVLVAEMGTYGPGEIRDMCRFVPPDIAAITAIGPVHLERMKSEDRIAEAKSEIFERASVAVLNADDHRLAALADRLEATGGKKVVRVGAADLGDLSVPPGAPPTNVAVAVAIARQLGVPDDAIAARLATLPTAAHRLTTSTGTSGATIVDDTYNSNPAGAAAALAALTRHATDGGKRVVVTPGMVELGSRQADENRAFATAVAESATHLLIVGQTNRRALQGGAAHGNITVVLVDTREDAVSWVQDHLGPGDVVLYENDLPDHYP